MRESKQQKKYAILSMDVEDWYHLDYFLDMNTDRTLTMLDGLNNYLEILEEHDIKTTFFVLGELAKSLESKIKEITSVGHEIACHGFNHIRPVQVELDEYRKQIRDAKEILSNICGEEIIGYRAPSYGLDDEHFNIIRSLGFKYDSSRIGFSQHPLYRSFDISSFDEVVKGIYKTKDFFEFEVSTRQIFNFQLPISGGGYFRLFPWRVSKYLIGNYLKNAELYVFYIHPFELSKKAIPRLPEASIETMFRANVGRGQVKKRIENLIVLLKNQGYEFHTFKELRDILI